LAHFSLKEQPMSEPNEPFSDEIPPRLAADLSRAVRRPVEIPASVDATILAGARKHAVVRRRFRYWRSSLAATAAAATILLAWLLWPAASPPGGQLAMDLDRSGRVDILDAYQLARQLPNGKDLNGDGRVDQADVDAIAQSAVDLKGGPRP
jgi:hypothetical protein